MNDGLSAGKYMADMCRKDVKMTLEEALKKITPLKQEAVDAAWKRWSETSIPIHSLGKLQDAVAAIAGMLGTPDVALDKKALVVMCADNGIVEEGISQSGQEVTKIIAENFLKEKATAAIFCKKSGADVFPVDIGIASDNLLPNHKVAYGTKNFAKEPAMTREQAVQAIEVGIHMAEELYEKGYRILATGEMGIGNTTTSSAMTAVYTGVSPAEVTGRGAGLSSAGLQKKVQVIEDAIVRYHMDPEDPIGVLSCVGGFDIAGMCGVFLGGAALGIPVVIDGFISGVAALTAYKLCPTSRQYMFASHLSQEPASKLILDTLGIEGFMDCRMRLGEGSGAVLLFPILDMAMEVYRSVASFDENNMEHYVPLS